MNMFPTKILLASDGSEEAELAVRVAAELAKNTGSELHLLHVEDVPVLATPSVPRPPAAMSEEQARELLYRQAEQIREGGVSDVETYLKEGRPADEIVRFGEELGAGLIVMGARGLSGLKRLLVGSTSEVVVRYASCPVLVVRKGGAEAFPTRLLMATDGSEDSALAARAAAEFSEKLGSELHLVHVGDAPILAHSYAKELIKQSRQTARELLEEQTERVKEAGAEVAEAHVRVGRSSVEEIIGLAEELEIGAVVVGSRGTDTLTRAVMGGVSESVVQYAHCSVLVIRGEVKHA